MRPDSRRRAIDASCWTVDSSIERSGSISGDAESIRKGYGVPSSVLEHRYLLSTPATREAANLLGCFHQRAPSGRSRGLRQWRNVVRLGDRRDAVGES